MKGQGTKRKIRSRGGKSEEIVYKARKLGKEATKQKSIGLRRKGIYKRQGPITKTGRG